MFLSAVIYNDAITVVFGILATAFLVMACVWNIIAIVNFIKALTKRGWEPLEKKRLVYSSLVALLLSNTYTFYIMFEAFSRILPSSLGSTSGMVQTTYLIDMNLFNAYIGLFALASMIVQLCFIKKVAKMGYENSKDRFLAVFLWIASLLAQVWALLMFVRNLCNINDFDTAYIVAAYLLATAVSIVILVFGIICASKYKTGSKITNHSKFATFAIVFGVLVTLISGVGFVRWAIADAAPTPIYDSNGRRVDAYGQKENITSSGKCYSGINYGTDDDVRNKYYSLDVYRYTDYTINVVLETTSSVTIYLYDYDGNNVYTKTLNGKIVSYTFTSNYSTYYIKFTSNVKIINWNFNEKFTIDPLTRMGAGIYLEAEPGFSFAGEFIQLDTQKNASYKVTIHKEGYSEITISLYDSNSNLVDQSTNYYSNLTYSFDSKDTKYYIIVETSDRVYYMGLDKQ